MILGLEIGMLIAGLYAMVKGKINWTKSRVTEGAPARVAGVILVLPLPLALAVGLVVGVGQVARGRGDVKDLQLTLTLTEVGIVLACLALAVVFSLAFSRPAEPEPRRPLRHPPPDRRAPPARRPAEPEDAAEVLPAPPEEGVQVGPPARPRKPPPREVTARPAPPAREGARPVARRSGVGPLPWIIGGVAVAFLGCTCGASVLGYFVWSRLSASAATTRMAVARAPAAPAPWEREKAGPAAPQFPPPAAPAPKPPEDGLLLRLSPGPVSVSFSPDGKTLATGEAALVRLWDRATGHQTGNVPGTGPLAYTADGKLLLKMTSTLRVWDLGANRPLPAGYLGDRFCLSADGRALATLQGQGVQVYEVGTARAAAVWSAPKDFPPGSIALSPDGRSVALGSWRHPAALLYSNAGAAGGKTAAQTAGGLGPLAFSPDGKLLVAAAYDNSTLLVWDTVAGREVRKLDEPMRWPATALAFAPNGRLLATGVSNGFVRLWDTAGWRDVASFKVSPEADEARGGPDNIVSSVAFSPDGKYVAAGAPGRAKVWELARLLDGRGPPGWDAPAAPPPAPTSPRRSRRCRRPRRSRRRPSDSPSSGSGWASCPTRAAPSSPSPTPRTAGRWPSARCRRCSCSTPRPARPARPSRRCRRAPRSATWPSRPTARPWPRAWPTGR